MKKLLLLTTLWMLSHSIYAQYCGVSGASICTPSGTLNSPGFSPTSEALPALVNGELSSTVLQFKNFDTITFGGQVLTVQTLRIDSIGNLPAGLCWSTNKNNNTWNNQEDGCLVFNGTTCSTPGQYKLRMIITVNVGVPIQTDADAANLKYFLRVKNTGAQDLPVDTTQTNNNYIIPYGPAADCNPVFSVNLGADKTVCNGSNITLNPVTHSGVPPYTYNWSSTGDALSCTTCEHPQVSLTQTSLFSVTVIDATNASVSDNVNYTNNGNTNQVQFTINSTGIDCANPTDNTTVAITGGTSPYYTFWGDGADSTWGATPSHIYNQQGTYVISVTDANNCVTSNTNTVNFNGILITATQTTQPNCNNQNTGAITINATGGTGPYTYAWNNNAITNSISNLSAGIYTVTVTDATGCSFAKTINLAPLSGWGYYIYTAASASNCNNNGSITTYVYGGTAPYTYAWNNGSTVQNLSGISGGVYNLSVTDANGCIAIGAATVPTTCYSLVSGNVFSDLNGNCTLDTGETQLTQSVFITAQGNNGQTYYSYASANGNYTIMIPEAGTFTLGASSSGGVCGILTLCNSSNQIVTLANIGDTSLNNNFGFSGAAGFDLNIHPGWTTGNPGFTKDYWVYYGNNSSTNYNGTATVSFNYDENLIYQSSTPVAQHNLATHTLTWLVDSIPANSYFWVEQLRCTFMVPQTLSLGHLLHSNFRMDPTVGDCDSSNNKLYVSETVVGSHDPNEKKVEPANDIFEEDSVLTYTIGFQNTGTDSTHFIIIKDTLSAYLDPTTVRNIASSHPYSDFSVSGTGILTWTFNPLRLVDSFTNEPGSHGFVKFTIKKKANLPLNTQISNTAHIYFDYNPAVVTNTVTNRLTEPNGIWHIRATDNVKVKAIPNPFSDGTNIIVEGVNSRFDFELYDVTGKLQNRIPAIETNQFYVTRDNLSAGIYLFKITTTDKKKTGYGKLVIE